MPRDSADRLIEVGTRVCFRGREYTIESFVPGGGRFGTNAIRFREPQHTDEVADEISVDRVQR